MKLVEMAARKMKEWPELGEFIYQGDKGYVFSEVGILLFYDDLAEDWFDARVTRAKWETERARILLESQPERDADVAKVVDAGKSRNKEEQALWDEVYLQSQKMFFDAAGDLDCIDDIAYRIGKWADAFMAERAKRIKGEQ